MEKSIKENTVKRSATKPQSTLKPKHIPQEIKDAKRWLVWQWNSKGNKWDKPPLTLDGHNANKQDSANWHTFDEALQAVQDNSFDGLGFCLGPDGAGVLVQRELE